MSERDETRPDGLVRRFLPRPLAWVLRIRAKLILLHTTFSITLALILLVSLQPAVSDILRQAQTEECTFALRLFHENPGADLSSASHRSLNAQTGDASALGLSRTLAARAQEQPLQPVTTITADGDMRAALYDPATNRFSAVTLASSSAERAVRRLYIVLVVALLIVYALIAVALEAFVLPRQVYRPIGRLLSADDAVQKGDRDEELIPEDDIPNDELGGIMRSRNRSIIKLREQETALADALQRVEIIASELKKKNHLLEAARRNLTDQDRLASLGMLSAGIAHELNTPLAVLKGTAERFAEHPDHPVDQEKVALMRRVIERLERLGDSLLDFARARSPRYRAERLAPLADEAWTLISLDRDAQEITFHNEIPGDLTPSMDADRITQVFVNLIRNAVDAIHGEGTITLSARVTERDGEPWATISITDDGPGIEPTLFPRLFEPFASSRLDADGTGLGLAVAEGIIKEHNGVITARNNTGRGATFEIVIPAAPGDDTEYQHADEPTLFEHTTGDAP